MIPPPRPGRAPSFTYIVGVYAVAIGLAWAGFELAPWEPHWAVATGLLLSVAATFYFGIFPSRVLTFVSEMALRFWGQVHSV